MKILLDQNLSYRLALQLKDIFPTIKHVRELGLEASEDIKVWEYAKRNHYTIVSKDSDFHQLSFLLGPPPQVIWIKLGNCSTKDIEKILRKSFKTIKKFNQEKKSAFLILS